MDDAVKALCTAMDKLRAGAAALEESGSTRELQDALMACWVPLPSQFAGCELVSANLRWPRASPMSFFVDFNHGMPVKLPLQVVSPSWTVKRLWVTGSFNQDAVDDPFATN